MQGQQQQQQQQQQPSNQFRSATTVGANARFGGFAQQMPMYRAPTPAPKPAFGMMDYMLLQVRHYVTLCNTL
jgi:hypothetical protein